jgi:hypothetical protein
MLRLAHHDAAPARTASSVNILLGLWLIVSPWAFDYSGKSAVLCSVTVGALIALLAAARVASLHDSAGLSAINLLLAFWTVASPWAYQYGTNEGAMLNNIIVGILVASLASWSTIATDAEEPTRGRASGRLRLGSRAKRAARFTD